MRNPVFRDCLPERAAALRAAGTAIILWVTAVCEAHPRFLIDVWTPYDGLPQSRVTSVVQTPQGYLWIATHLGWLARFDGVRFQHFNPDNTPALGSPEIQKLMVAEEGTLWISDIDGRLISHKNGVFASRIEPKPGYERRVVDRVGGFHAETRFITASGGLLRLGAQAVYEGDPTRPASHPQSIRQFCQTDEGVLWCRTVSGRIGVWEEGRFEPQPASGGIQTAGVNHLLAQPVGGLRVATNDGLWQLGPDGFARSRVTLAEPHRQVIRIAACPDGGLWLLTVGGLVLTRGERIVSSIDLPGLDFSNPSRLPEIRVDTAGAAWLFNTDQGVVHVAPTGAVTQLNSRNGLPGDQVETWLEDREKNIWLGTVGGLVRLRPRWFHLMDAAAGPGSAVVSISQDAGGDIWLGCAKGLTRWRDGIAENIPLPRFPPRPNIAIANITIAPGDSPGEIWLGSVESGAMRLVDERIDHPFPFDAPGLAIRTIRRDPQGGIWFGGEFGLFRWDGTRLRKFGPEDGLTPGHIHDIAFDSEGSVWIAKADDLLSVCRNGRFEAVPLPGVPPGLRMHTVLCGSDGSVFLGSVGAGLIHLTRGKVLRYTTEHGLPGNSVPQLLEDDKGFLWGGTHRGIFRVSTTALDMRSKGVNPPFLFHVYGHSDGLPEAECSGGLQPACWKAADGSLWFSTTVGAVRTHPEHVTKNLHPPTAVIEEFRVNDRVLETEPAPAMVPPGNHRYEFRFTALSTTAPQKAGFQWKLAGVDADWVQGHDQRSVAYSGLAPGEYRLDVRARNQDGVWSVEPAALTFRVAPFVWQRPSVRALVAFLMLAGGFLAIAVVMRRRHQRELRAFEYASGLEQQRYRHKQAMEAERARIAAELHDDLGANLTQIQWLADPANFSGTPEAGRDLLQRVSRKSRETVRLIDEIVWAVNPKNDTLEELVTYVCNFAEQYFRDTATRVRIDVAGPIPKHPLPTEARHQLFLIAKEAFHNVAKHAATDRVWVRFRFDGGRVRLVIEDRGRGFDPTSGLSGDGLANMRRRAAQAGARFAMESAPGAGTTVAVELETPNL